MVLSIQREVIMKKRIFLIGTMSCLLIFCAFLMVACGGGHVHSFTEWTTVTNATCTQDGSQESICTCGEKQTRTIAATGHTYGEWVVTTPATCTTTGEKERYCECGDKQTQTIAATGHDYVEATCTAPKTCKNCGKTVGEALGHTCNVGTCSRCGQTIYPPVRLPATPFYVSYLSYSTMKITSLTYKYDERGNLIFTYDLEKTYDKYGSDGTSSVGGTYYLRDADGYVITTSYLLVADLKVGDKVKGHTFKINHSNFDSVTTEYFVLEITDRN